MKNKKIAILIVLLVLCGAALSYFYYVNGRNGHGIIASGTIEATEVDISSKVSGKILKINIDEGSNVEAGDVIAEIDKKEYEAQLFGVKSACTYAEDQYKRAKELFKKDFISKSNFDAAKSAYQAAKAKLDLAQIQLNDTTIVSPIKGVVLTKAVEEGELAIAGSIIATVANLDSLDVTVYISEKNLGKIRLGQQVNIFVDSFPDEPFNGTISKISNKAEFTPKNIQTKDERTTLVFGVKIKIDNKEHKLKPGMSADAEIKWTVQ